MLESGQALSARFTLVRRLGAGGSGEVWLAHDRERACTVALKILAQRLLEPATAAALERECELIRRLEHPNILRVDGLYRAGHHDRYLAWIAMEYASGGDLTQLRGRSCTQVLRAVLPIAGALAHAHAAGVVHRDVKCANVLFASDGTPKLADFGTALAMGEVAGEKTGPGSPYSMSPQQRAGAPASVADDLYGFGALLYELLSGYPPGYVRTGGSSGATPPAALPGSVPAALASLVERLLADSPADRPSDMKTVERELKAALAELPAPAIVNNVNERPAIRIEPPSAAPPPGEPLRPQWQRGGSEAAGGQPAHRDTFARRAGAAAIAIGATGVALVFFVLPQWVRNDEPARYAPAASTVKPAQPEQPAAKQEIDFAELARAKQRAEDLKAAIDERLENITARGGEQWGGHDFQSATEALAAGDKAYEAREYIVAAEQFGRIEPLVALLEKRAGIVLAEQLKAGATALEQGRSADAKTAFELAAKIERNNAVAARGLKRAATLDQVLNLVATAQRLEREGNRSAALENFRKALAVDNEAPRAADGIARIEAQFASDSFASAMARGFSALASSDYERAQAAFEAARKIRPNAPEIQQALQQIEQEQRTGTIAVKLRAAQEHESQERWADALKEYRAVVALDSTVAAAQEGVARVSPRASLNEQLEMYLTQPERLFSQPVRAAARESLARAASVSNPGPLLQRQMATLQDWIAHADVPVQVALESDNLTQVTIYRVGSLGTFSQRSLELVPGSYTVVGTRPGYRDVRREIRVAPGAPPEPIVIRCEDRI